MKYLIAILFILSATICHAQIPKIPSKQLDLTELSADSIRSVEILDNFKTAWQGSRKAYFYYDQDGDFIMTDTLPAVWQAIHDLQGGGGGVRLQYIANSGLFNTSSIPGSVDYMDKGTVGSDWSYTIPAGTFSPGSDKMIRISLTIRTGNGTNRTGDLELEIDSGPYTKYITLPTSISVSDPSLTGSILITSRSASVAYYSASFFSGSESYQDDASTNIDWSENITLKFRYTNPSTGTPLQGDMNILPLTIETADR